MSKPAASAILGCQSATGARWLLAAALVLPVTACDSPASGTDVTDGGAGADAGSPLTGDPCAALVTPMPTGDALLCPVTVTYTPTHAGQVAIAGEWNGFSINRTAAAAPTAVPLPAELGGGVGTKLRDRLSGEAYLVTGAVLMADVPARGGLLLAPE